MIWNKIKGNKQTILFFGTMLFTLVILIFLIYFIADFDYTDVSEAARFKKKVFDILSQGEVIVGIGVALPTILLWKSELDNRQSDRQVSNFEYSFKIKSELEYQYKKILRFLHQSKRIKEEGELREIIREVEKYIEFLDQINKYKNRELIIITNSNKEIYNLLVFIQKNNRGPYSEKLGELLTKLLICDKNDSLLKTGDVLSAIEFLFDIPYYESIDFKEVLSKTKSNDFTFLFKENSHFENCKIDIRTFSQYTRHDESSRIYPKFSGCTYYIGRREVKNEKYFENHIKDIVFCKSIKSDWRK